MRYGRRMLAALMALAIVLLCGAQPASLFTVAGLAEENVQPELDVSVSMADAPDASGGVTLNFTLINRSDAVLSGLCLTAPDGGLTELQEELAPSESVSFVYVGAASQEEPDVGAMRFALTGEADGEAFSYPVEALLYPDAEPQIEFLRQVSNEVLPDGGSVAVVYRVVNEGETSVGNLVISDSLGNFEAQRDQLAPGERWTVLQRVSVTEDAVSAPVLSYSENIAVDNVSTSQLDALTVHAAQSRLDSSLTAGRSLFDPGSAEVILSIANSGEVDYRNVAVYDDVYGGMIADAIQLPVGGESVEIAHSYPLRGDGSYRWRVIGETAAGDHIDFITETVSVRDETGDHVLLTLSAAPSAARINRSGYVAVELEVSNIGSALATNVLIHEEALGEICRLTVVPTGDPTIVQARLKVTENTTYAFHATYVDRFGQQRTDAAEPFEITIGAGGASPEQDDRNSALFSGISVQMGNSSLFLVLLIGSMVVLITLIVVLLITSRRARKRRKERAAARKQRVRGEQTKARRNPKK